MTTGGSGVRRNSPGVGDLLDDVPAGLADIPEVSDVAGRGEGVAGVYGA
jgi:hypothetical protein